MKGECFVSYFSEIEVNAEFEWGGLRFQKTSLHHGLCLDDESKSQMFHDVASVTPVRQPDGEVREEACPEDAEAENQGQQERQEVLKRKPGRPKKS